jgi:alpha-beta hydrolase superfamily lysophospholipase
MIHNTYDWTTSDRKHIFGQSWSPPTTARAVICLIHGQGEHSSRYVHVAEFLLQQHIAVLTCDLVGHGKSGGLRGHVRRFEDYVAHVDLLIAEAGKLFPATPLFVYGHSMGGAIALTHACKATEAVKGYIITSPWIRLAFEPPAWKVMLGKAVKNIYPAMQQPTGLDAAKISHDVVEVKKYREDVLNHDKISASAFFEIFSNGKNILNRADVLRLPILLLHGTGDGLTSHLASRELAALRKDLITYYEFEGLYHELHNEFERLNILQTILLWLEQQIKP